MRALPGIMQPCCSAASQPDNMDRSYFGLETQDMKAIWNNATIAESDNTVVIEGNHYFPADSINKDYFQRSETHSTCPWKGIASYYNVVVDGKTNADAAW